MTTERFKLLVEKANRGELNRDEQQEMAIEAEIYHKLALRAERALHAIIKEQERQEREGR